MKLTMARFSERKSYAPNQYIDLQTYINFVKTLRYGNLTKKVIYRIDRHHQLFCVSTTHNVKYDEDCDKEKPTA